MDVGTNMNNFSSASVPSAGQDLALRVLNELVVLDTDLHTDSHSSGANAFDHLHADKGRVLALLRYFGRQLHQVEEDYSFGRLDPVRGSRTEARSHHGLVAYWAGQVAAIAQAYRRPLRRIMRRWEGGAARQATAVGLVSRVFTAMKGVENPAADPDHRERMQFIDGLSYFAEKLKGALNGFQKDAQLLREGVKLEVRRAQAAANSTGKADSPRPPEPKPVDETALGDIASRVLACLRKTPDLAVHIDVLSKAANVIKGSERAKKRRGRALDLLIDRGLICRLRRGWYKAVLKPQGHRGTPG